MIYINKKDAKYNISFFIFSATKIDQIVLIKHFSKNLRDENSSIKINMILNEF